MKKLLILLISTLTLVSCQETKKETTATTPEHKNEVVEAIKSRRSIRSYKPEQIDQAQLDTIIDCAINAPSALNKQSWEVRVIQNPDLLKRINDSFVEKAKGKELKGNASRAQESDFSVFHGSPTLIIVGREKNNSTSFVDCGLLAQNVMLSAESMNIGTCVIGSISGILNDPDSGFLKEINMPDTHEVAFGISIGYKNENPEAKPRDASKVQYIK